jgi:diguanylate cyclase (GGDEF)-like protein
MTVFKEKKGARISLVKVFSTGITGILFIFILLTYFTFTRLLSFESTLKDISDKSLPNLIRISQLYSQAARLLESTELLSKSASGASKRLAQKRLSTNIINIRKAANNAFVNVFLDTQLDTIAIELDEFSALIEDSVQTLENIELLRAQMYNINVQAVNIKKQSSSVWVLGFSQVITDVSKALNEKKLQRVRFLFNQLEKQLNKLSTISGEGQDKAVRRQLTNQFKILLFDENGMELLKVKSLRLEGRAIGRENFVHNLIEDYIAQLSLLTNETEQNITLKVATSVVDMKEQTQLIRLILIGGVVFLLIIVVLFQQRILKRISIFKQIVLNETQEFDYQTMLNGNDEITDLAEAFNEFTHTIDIQKQKLEQLSMLDGLTGIANRRALDIRLKHDIEISTRQKSSVAILLMDIDCFKQYNDNYGHSAGDQCLKDVAKIIGDSLHRDSDFVARYGGEEFVCVLPETNSEGAQMIATHLLEQFKHAALPHKSSNVADYVTVSIGITTSQPTALLTPEAIIRQADTALYIAKKAGKNSSSLYFAAKPLN